jgi:hypothetical protein
MAAIYETVIAIAIFHQIERQTIEAGARDHLGHAA